MSMRSNKTINLIGASAAAASILCGSTFASAQQSRQENAKSYSPSQPQTGTAANSSQGPGHPSGFLSTDCQVHPRTPSDTPGISATEGITFLEPNGRSLVLDVPNDKDLTVTFLDHEITTGLVVRFKNIFGPEPLEIIRTNITNNSSDVVTDPKAISRMVTNASLFMNYCNDRTFYPFRKFFPPLLSAKRALILEASPQ